MRHLAIALSILLLAPTVAPAQAPGAGGAPDYANPAAWICRPDRPGACDVDLTTTVIDANGTATVERASIDPKAPIDCFYVYPTVSMDTAAVSDLVPDAFERNIVRLQFARFGTQCRVFAPMYRQVTTAAVGRAIATKTAPDFAGVGLDDIRAAWRYYLEHDNNGRGVVLIGHSQGTAVLTELLHRDIEGAPVQSRIISALLLGAANVMQVPKGRDVGGTFKQMPLCRRDTQIGCVVSYSAFRATQPPSATSFFGRATDSTHVAACTNPAALGGGDAPLDGYFDAGGRTALALDASNTWTANGAPITTPFVRVVGLLRAHCATNAFATVLDVTVNRRLASRDIQGDLIDGFGLHLVDAEVAMGNLVALVAKQRAAYLSGGGLR